MARRGQDEVPKDRNFSVLRMIDAVDEPRRRRRNRPIYLTPRRRVLVWSLGIGAVVAGGGGTVAALVAESSDGHDGPRRVRPGPSTIAAAGRLAGPARAPLWTAATGDDVLWIAAAGDRVLACGKALTAYDGASGRVVWSSADAAMPGLYNTGPLVVGNTVYGVGVTGGIMVVSAADGSVAWQLDPPSDHWYAWGVVGVSERYLVTTGSVDAGVAVPVGAAASAAVSASAAGGSPGAGAGPSATSPGSSDSPDPSSSVTMVWVVDVETHQTVWAAPVGGSSDPAIAFCAQAGIVALYDEKSGVITAYDVQQGAVRWRFSDPTWTADNTPYACAMTVYENTLYLAVNGLLAVDAQKGSLLWKADAPSAPYGLYHAVTVIPAADTGFTGPDIVVAAATGSLDPGELDARHATTGEQIWSEAGDDDFGLGRILTVDGGTVYYPDRYTGSLFAVDAATGETRWTFHDGSATTDMQFTATAANGRAYLHYGTTLRAFG